MLWCYDNAIADDLASVLDNSSGINTTVKIMDAEQLYSLIAQIKEDQISFPIVCLTRIEDTPIDTNRATFVAMHKGVPVVVENDENNIYYERSIPIELKYTLTVLTTNTVDQDEVMREIMFRYLKTYFISLTVPYESKRIIRFGVRLDPGSLRKKSASLEYLKEGALYQSQIDLNCDGAVMLSYTPSHMKRMSDTDVTAK